MIQAFKALSIAAAALAAFSFPLQAAPEDDDPIVVTGTRMTQKEAHKLARSFARDVLSAPVGDQNARWNDPLCIGAVGLQEEIARPLIDRIEVTALDIGARIDKTKCTPNVLLIFTGDSDAAYAEIVRRQPWILSKTWEEDRKRLNSPGLPVRWFYGHEFEGVGGRQIGPQSGALPGGDVAGLDLPILNDGTLSRINSPVQLSLETALVLIDVPRIAGVPFDALADYISFAILARSRVDAAPEGASILGLFRDEPSNRAASLTDLDLALLKALYKLPPNRTAAVHRNQMASEMVKSIAAKQ